MTATAAIRRIDNSHLSLNLPRGFIAETDAVRRPEYIMITRRR